MRNDPIKIGRGIEKSLSNILSFLLDGEARACADKRPWRSALTPIQLLFYHAENLPILTVSQNLQVIHIQNDLIIFSFCAGCHERCKVVYPIQVCEREPRQISFPLLAKCTGLTRMDVFRAFFLLHAAKVRSSCEEGPGQSALQSAYHDPHLDVNELKQNRTTLSFRPKIANKQINKLDRRCRWQKSVGSKLVQGEDRKNG